MRLNELFDKPKDIRVERNDDNSFIISSVIDDDTELGLSATKDSNGWGVLFIVNGEMGLTGQGKEIAIFSTVMQMMKMFLKAKNPDVITFTGDKTEGNRVRLYTRLVNKFASQYGYDNQTKQHTNAVEFILTRQPQ